jgi:hypothetical protein
LPLLAVLNLGLLWLSNLLESSVGSCLICWLILSGSFRLFVMACLGVCLFTTFRQFVRGHAKFFVFFGVLYLYIFNYPSLLVLMACFCTWLCIHYICFLRHLRWDSRDTLIIYCLVGTYVLCDLTVIELMLFMNMWFVFCK